MKTDYKYILDNSSSQQFRVNTKLYDLGRQAEIIAKVAQDKIQEDGANAQVFASNVVSWMQEIADVAQKGLDIQFGKE